MAHFAQLNSDNIVTQVVVVNNSDLLDANGIESEQVGISFLEQHLGSGPWLQTSYNGKMRGKYAGIGDRYDPISDVFTSPQEPLAE
jgi:hypothetical protein